jgi:hypothetical protein
MMNMKSGMMKMNSGNDMGMKDKAEKEILQEIIQLMGKSMGGKIKKPDSLSIEIEKEPEGEMDDMQMPEKSAMSEDTDPMAGELDDASLMKELQNKGVEAEEPSMGDAMPNQDDDMEAKKMAAMMMLKKKM